MGFFDKFKTKTIEDVVDTAKTAVTETVRNGMDDKVKSALYLLPIAATAFLVFRGDGKSVKEQRDIPTRQVINNYYYYGERQVKPRVSDARKGRD